MVGAEKLKERLLKLVQEGIRKIFWLAERRQRDMVGKYVGF